MEKGITSVGVYLITPDGCVLLQKRAKTEIKDEVEKEQSNAGVCQPTFNGKMKEEESLASAVKRECEEELGTNFANNLNLYNLNKFSEKNYIYKEKKAKSYGFWGFIDEKDIKKIKLHSGALPDLVYVRYEDLKKIGDKKSNKEIKMFPDQYKELKELFEILKKKKIV